MGEVKTGEAGETKDETLVEENGTDKTTEEDVDDEGDELQSAWEWLEVASKICEKFVLILLMIKDTDLGKSSPIIG